MVSLDGAYGNAKVFTTTIEASAKKQITTLLDHPIAEGAHVRIMPDCHAGAGCVIGYTAALTAKVVPNLIGVDIGCGVCGWKLEGVRKIDFLKLDEYIRRRIPSGRNVRGSVHPAIETFTVNDQAERTDFHRFEKDINRAVDRTAQDGNRVWRSIGTLGGGNHFIEIETDESGTFWLVIHSGSRNFGLQIARWHQKKALAVRGNMNGLEYLEGRDKKRYLEDMKIAQEYATRNRRVMGYEICTAFFDLDFHNLRMIESVHNYINFNDQIVRKGAISAHHGEEVIIPLNMAEGSIIGRGKGNLDWNKSAPHGAGRKLSRRQAKKEISLNEFQTVMEKNKVWTSCVGKKTLDESPQAYKKTKQLLKDLAPTLDVTLLLKSVYNFKAPS